MFPPVLSEPRRQQILRVLWGKERRAGEVAESLSEISFAAVSQHLAKLHDAGLVSRRREGREIYYAVRREALGPLAQALDQMWGDQLAELKRLAEAEESRKTRIGATRPTRPGSRKKRSSPHGRRPGRH
jgi:DNA-binding transcriptional ArsR family regulator